MKNLILRPRLVWLDNNFRQRFGIGKYNFHNIGDPFISMDTSDFNLLKMFTIDLHF
jgi:hypothetical protein